jgi:2-amino-4-hydroxy-6-hydroxymethyldihydropteridine diphosphokinase
MRAWVGLGGNHGDSAALLRRALQLLGSDRDIRVVRHSRLYSSPPWGLKEQADYVNAVAEVDTRLRPRPLLRRLLSIERSLGRDRDDGAAVPRWGPRPIDLDLLSYGGEVIDSDDLVLPHPRMHLRAFVLVPLLELAPDFTIPGDGAAADCLRRVDPDETAAVVPLATT